MFSRLYRRSQMACGLRFTFYKNFSGEFLGKKISEDSVSRKGTLVGSSFDTATSEECHHTRGKGTGKGIYFITAGWLLALIEAFRRNNISIINDVNALNIQAAVSTTQKSWNFIADVVEKAAPTVVYIEILGKHPFTGKTVAVSNGSGFIVRPDGLIITNAHVVGNSTKVKVRLSDGTHKVGVVQAVDSVSDLATVKISGENLPTLKLGNSHQLRPGEFVVAMGSPLQLSNTVTAGIVSSANRKSEDLGLHNKDINYIQTDATINFGNSGGPLINLDGEAIGINTMMVTSGISFAIPSDYASEFLAKAAELEKRSQGKKLNRKDDTPDKRYIGITMVTLTPDLVRTLRNQHRDLLNVDEGVLVYRIVPGSPADIGGIMPGDIITKINGKKITNSEGVYKALGSNDDKLAVDVIRGQGVLILILQPETFH